MARKHASIATPVQSGVVPILSALIGFAGVALTAYLGYLATRDKVSPPDSPTAVVAYATPTHSESKSAIQNVPVSTPTLLSLGPQPAPNPAPFSTRVPERVPPTLEPGAEPLAVITPIFGTPFNALRDSMSCYVNAKPELPFENGAAVSFDSAKAIDVNRAPVSGELSVSV